jgi:hypothetical protein
MELLNFFIGNDDRVAVFAMYVFPVKGRGLNDVLLVVLVK